MVVLNVVSERKCNLYADVVVCAPCFIFMYSIDTYFIVCSRLFYSHLALLLVVSVLFRIRFLSLPILAVISIVKIYYATFDSPSAGHRSFEAIVRCVLKKIQINNNGNNNNMNNINKTTTILQRQQRKISK